MQEAFGGILNIVFVAIFLVIVSGVLAFTVTYTKAFKMKNIVISAIEEYEDAQCTNPDTPNSPCRLKIRQEASNIGYSPTSLNCPSDFRKIDDLFCVKQMTAQNKKYYVYRIITQVDLNIPIIQEILSFSFFQVGGDTRVVQKQS